MKIIRCDRCDRESPPLATWIVNACRNSADRPKDLCDVCMTALHEWLNNKPLSSAEAMLYMERCSHTFPDDQAPYVLCTRCACTREWAMGHRGGLVSGVGPLGDAGQS